MSEAGQGKSSCVVFDEVGPSHKRQCSSCSESSRAG